MALPAQTFRLTAHPQDLPHTNTGQAVPLSDDAMLCESRSQLLLRAEHLPGPGAILRGIEFMALISGPVHYESLVITVSPVPTTAPRSASFAANLPQPTQVVQLANHSMYWNGTNWQRFVSTAGYVHDGVSSLTIDIQKNASAGNNNGASTGLYRPDLETMFMHAGGENSGLHQAVTASWQVIPIDVRLVWSDAPVSRLRSPIPGANHHGFAIGSWLQHVVAATPNSLAVLLGDLQWSSPVLVPWAAGPWRVQGVTLGVDVVGVAGEVTRTYPIPLLPAFVGQRITYQAVVLDAVTGILQFTNGSDCILAQ
jgi:hypothetical protein